jgi:hypothetical protein
VTHLWIALFWAALGLETAVAAAVFKNGRKEFPLFCVYTILYAVATIVMAFCYLIHRRAAYALLYWILDIAVDYLVVAVILGLIRRALLKRRFKEWWLYAAALGALVVPVALAYDARFGFWMTASIRNLSFAAEILNLALWMLLVQNQEAASRFLWVSAGLGIQVTGQVLGHTLRLMSSHAAIWAPNLLINVCQFTALGIWLYAFCREPKPARSRPESGFTPPLKPAGGSPGSPFPSAASFRD